MSTEVVVGVIGLAGALVGAMAAFLGIVYQQRHQAKQVQLRRRDEIAEAAVDILIAELEELRKLAWSRPDEGERSEAEGRRWTESLREHLSKIALATLRLPNRELRERLEAAHMGGFGDELWIQEATGLRGGRLLMLAMCREAQQCLGSYLRQEPMPRLIFLPAAHREFQALLDNPPPDA